MSDTIGKQYSADAHRLLRGFQWTYISVAVQGLLKLIVLVILARVLTPRDFGLLGFALICTNFVERIGQVGVAPALVQTAEAGPNTVTTAWYMSILLGFLSAAVVCIGAGWMAAFFHEPALLQILYALAVGCVLEGLAAIPDALLQRELRFREIMIADNVAYFISMACIGTALALLDWGVWALVVAQLALKVVRACILGYFVRPMPRGDWSYSSGVRLMWMGFGFSLGRLLNFFSLQGDNFVVGRLLGVEALGMYNRAYQLMTLPAMYVGQVIERVMFPLMAQKQHSRARLVQDFLLTLEAITIVSLPVGVVMYYLAEEIIVVGFGQQWRAVVPVVSILSFGVFFRTAYKCSDTVVRSVGAVYHYAARQAMYTGLVVTGSFAGAWYAGLEGVAVGVVVAVGLNYVSMTRLSSVTIGTPFIEIVRAHYSGLWVAVCVAIGMGVAVPQLRASCDSPVIVLGLGCVLAVILWLCSVVVATRIFPQGILEKMTRLIRDYQPLFGIGSRQAR